MKELNNFAITLMKEPTLIIERHDETVFISNNHAIYEISLDIYDEYLRTYSPLFLKLKNHITYRSINHSGCRPYFRDCYLEKLYKNIKKSAVDLVKQTDVLLAGLSTVRIYTNHRDLTVCLNNKYISLANDIGIDTSTALAYVPIAPIAFDRCVICPTIVGEAKKWEDLVAIAKIHKGE